MPALLAVIGANADPMKRELAAVQRMAQQAGVSLKTNLNGGHAGQSGIIRETLVLMREISRGNFTRVPGSLSILLQKMGVLNLILRDSSRASRMVAEAWEAQSRAASIAAIAATRKASASLAAFEADAANTEATLAQAVADEEGAAAAIMNAKATQMKAVAAQEAAAAEAESAVVALGPLAAGAAVVIGLLAGVYLAYKQVQSVKNMFTGLPVKDFHPDYIGKKNQSSNRAAEEQKEINNEVKKTIELYNSAAKSAERVSEATKNHFEHLRKMNSYERDPAKKAAQELAIDQQERVANLRNKYDEKASLEIEAQAKQRQAQAIQVSSKEHDENLLKQKKQAADEAQKFLDTNDPQTAMNAIAAANPFSGAGGARGMLAANAAKEKEARDRIAEYKSTVDQVDANEELRKKRAELIKQSGSSASAAAKIVQEIPGMTTRMNQANSDESEEAAAERKRNSKMMHGHVNSLQQIGAFAAPAVQVEIAKHSLHELKSINSKLDKIGGGSSSGLGRGKF